MGLRLILRARRAVVPALAVMLVLGHAPTAQASLPTRIHRVRDHLATLAAKIRVEERVVARVQNELAQLNRHIDRVTAEVARVQKQMVPLQREAAVLQARLDDLHGQIDQLGRQAFISQPGGSWGTMMNVVLASRTMADISDGMQFSESVSASIAAVANEIDVTKTALDTRLASLQTFELRKTTLLADIQAQRQRKHGIEVKHEQALNDLNQTRSQIVTLVRKLTRRWQLEMFPVIGSAFQGGAHTSYGRWSVLLLRSMGAPVCHSNEVVLIAWQLSEFTQAAWNPLATTKPLPGSTNFNSVGVQNFVSLAQGLEGTRLTLNNGASGYGSILANLHACSASMTTARAINASAWCHGCAGGQYLVNNIGKVEASFFLYGSF
jgi:predicted  nucleic acid-binding Zn-ribbon protein